jgi:hypothetical protein
VYRNNHEHTDTLSLPAVWNIPLCVIYADEMLRCDVGPKSHSISRVSSAAHLLLREWRFRTRDRTIERRRTSQMGRWKLALGVLIVLAIGFGVRLF